MKLLCLLGHKWRISDYSYGESQIGFTPSCQLICYHCFKKKLKIAKSSFEDRKTAWFWIVLQGTFN